MKSDSFDKMSTTNFFDIIENPPSTDQVLFEESNNASNQASYMKGSSEHRATCHRCGNVRKASIECTQCPHVFCKGCCTKMESEYGSECFAYGCPVCKCLCCCAEKSMTCSRSLHCYKRCPTTRGVRGQPSTSPTDCLLSDDLQYTLEQEDQVPYSSYAQVPSFHVPVSTGENTIPALPRHVQFESIGSSGLHGIMGTPSSATTQQYKATKRTTTGAVRGAKNGRLGSVNAAEVPPPLKKPTTVSVAVQTDLQDVNETLYVGNERTVNSYGKLTAIYTPYFLQPHGDSIVCPIKLISLYNLLHANVPDSNILNLVPVHTLPASRFSENTTGRQQVNEVAGEYADCSDDSRLSGLSATHLIEAAVAAATSPACLNGDGSGGLIDPGISPLNSSFATHSTGLRNVFADSEALLSHTPGAAGGSGVVLTPATPLSLNASFLFPASTQSAGGTGRAIGSAFSSPGAVEQSLGVTNRSSSPAYMFPWNAFFESSGQPSSAPTADSKKVQVGPVVTEPCTAVATQMLPSSTDDMSQGGGTSHPVSSIHVTVGAAVSGSDDQAHEGEKEEDEEANAAAYLMRIRSGPGHLGARRGRKRRPSE